jgi:hypothetical protein
MEVQMSYNPKMFVLDIRKEDNQVLLATEMPMIGKCNGCNHEGNEEIVLYTITHSSQKSSSAVSDSQMEPLHLCYECLVEGMDADKIIPLYN